MPLPFLGPHLFDFFVVSDSANHCFLSNQSSPTHSYGMSTLSAPGLEALGNGDEQKKSPCVSKNPQSTQGNTCFECTYNEYLGYILNCFLEFTQLSSLLPLTASAPISLNFCPQPLSLDSHPLFVPSVLTSPRFQVWPFSLSCSAFSPWEIATLKAYTLSITNDFQVCTFKPDFILVAACLYFSLDILLDILLSTQMDQDQILYHLPQAYFSS